MFILKNISHRKLIKNPKSYYLIFLVSIYSIFYGWVLSSSQGLPYVMDNNETYSSIAHARSIENFGIDKSFGLADEVFSPNINASPFVHSHQGNYPRLFSWVIHKMGANSPESQIKITTFTIGLGALLAAFFFFSIIVGPQFGLLCCLFYLTDYLFFSQWQVVTYRVWYAFTFFFQFYSIERIRESKYWIFFLLLNTILFSYGELVFAAYLLLASFLWAIFRSKNDIKLILLITSVIIFGFLFSFSLFIFQGIGFLGYENFLQDINLTFNSRNYSNNSNFSLFEVSKFYRDNNVIFWENIQSSSKYSGIIPFIQSIFTNFINTNSPLVIITVILMLFSSIFYILIPHKNLKLFNNLKLKKYFINNLFVIKYISISLSLMALTISGFYFVEKFYFQNFNVNLLPFCLILVVILTIFLVNIEFISILYLIYITLIIILLCLTLPFIIDNSYYPIWEYSLGNSIGKILPFLLPILGFLLTYNNTLYVKINGEYFYRRSNKQIGVNNCIIFILIGIISYSVVYYLSPGYINTGYIVRYAPFFVYYFDVILALCIYQSVLFGIFIYANSAYANPRNFRLIFLALSVLVPLIFLTAWARNQLVFLNGIPPNHYGIFKALNSPPYKNSSFISNTYAAPIFSQTGQWAYMDTQLMEVANFIEIGGVPRLLGDRRYLWFADRLENSEYRRPDYFICMLDQSPRKFLEYVKGSRHLKGCLDYPLIKLALKKDGKIQGLDLIEFDQKGLTNIGFVSWAIVKFDWAKLGGGLIWKDDPSVGLSEVDRRK